MRVLFLFVLLIAVLVGCLNAQDEGSVKPWCGTVNIQAAKDKVVLARWPR